MSMKNLLNVRYCGKNRTWYGILSIQLTRKKFNFDWIFFLVSVKFNPISQSHSHIRSEIFFLYFLFRKSFPRSFFIIIDPIKRKIAGKIKNKFVRKRTQKHLALCLLISHCLDGKENFIFPFSSRESPKVRVENKAK